MAQRDEGLGADFKRNAREAAGRNRRIELDATRGDLGAADDVQKIAHEGDATVQKTLADVSERIMDALDAVPVLGDAVNVGVSVGKLGGVSTATGRATLTGLFDEANLSFAALARPLNEDLRKSDARMRKNIIIDDELAGTQQSRAFFFDQHHTPMQFPGEQKDGSFLTKNPAQGPPVDDDDAYVPLSFTDVRPVGSDNTFRSVYFRPFITSLTEEFTPEYDKKTYYGRSDQVATYMSTMRTVFLGFEIHAFSPTDLELIYKKLNWLSSMVYPQYGSNMLMNAGPVLRMRVGDVISSRDKMGLPGVIDSLSYDYSDSIWEVDRDHKAPRTIKVAISFHILHDVVIGRGEDGDFGGIGYVNGEGKYTLDNGGIAARYDVDERATSNKVFKQAESFRGYGDITPEEKGAIGARGNNLGLSSEQLGFGPTLEEAERAPHGAAGPKELELRTIDNLRGIG